MVINSRAQAYDILEAYRVDHNISGRAFSRLSGVNRDQLQRHAAGEQGPAVTKSRGVHVLQRLAKQLNRSFIIHENGGLDSDAGAWKLYHDHMRFEKGLSLGELAERIGVTENLIGWVMNPAHFPANVAGDGVGLLRSVAKITGESVIIEG